VIPGNSGAGKTTLALQLQQKLNLPLYHLDQLWWLPGWKEDTRENFDRKLAEILRKDSWIIDGEYIRTPAERLKFADTAILPDYPSILCLWRALKRITS
jgi:adenylate kinase family enzyme